MRCTTGVQRQASQVDNQYRLITSLLHTIISVHHLQLVVHDHTCATPLTRLYDLQFTTAQPPRPHQGRSDGKGGSSYKPFGHRAAPDHHPLAVKQGMQQVTDAALSLVTAPARRHCTACFFTHTSCSLHTGSVQRQASHVTNTCRLCTSLLQVITSFAVNCA